MLMDPDSDSVTDLDHWAHEQPASPAVYPLVPVQTSITGLHCHLPKVRPCSLRYSFGNYISDKDFLSKIYKKFIQFNRKKSNSIKKWEKDLNKYFFKDIQMANKYMKRSSTSPAIRET